jgi:hypothetical protein
LQEWIARYGGRPNIPWDKWDAAIAEYTSIPQVGEKWLAVVAASDSCRGHDSRWLS